jgi:hypothetical protein
MKPMRSLEIKYRLWSIILALLLIPFSNGIAQLCSSPDKFIYGLTNVANIQKINTTNGIVAAPINPAYTGNVPDLSNAMGYSNLNGRFYYFKRNTLNAPQEFVSFDAGLNLVSYLASCPVGASPATIINVGCVNAAGTAYYGIDAYGGLFYYNIALNTWTKITSNLVDQFGTNLSTYIQNHFYGDCAFDGNGNLWYIPASATQFGVYKIKGPLPTTAVASVTVQQVMSPTTATPSGVSFGGIAFNSTGQIFISTNPPDDKLYRLNNNQTITFLATFSVSGIGNDLTSCNFPFSVLPVIWESFTAELNSNNQVLLKWAVSQQSINKGYAVEHSIDGVQWESLTFIATDPKEDGAAKYSFLHAKPVNGRHYYRIRQEDLDGNSNYSQIKIVDLRNNIHIELSPNPATDHIQIQVENIITSGETRARIYDFSGKLLMDRIMRNGINQLSVSSFTAGSYLVSVSTSLGEVYHERFIKQ